MIEAHDACTNEPLTSDQVVTACLKYLKGNSSWGGCLIWGGIKVAFKRSGMTITPNNWLSSVINS